MNLEKLINQFSGRKFGEFILQILQIQSSNSIEDAWHEKMDLLPIQFAEKEMTYIIGEYLEFGLEKSFWENECSETFLFLTVKAREDFIKNGLNPSEDDLLNVANCIVLCLAYSAHTDNKMRNFIEKSISKSFFNNLFKKRDISKNYRWSIVFKKNGTPQFEMLGDNVIQMLGYYMITLGEHENPKKPWELFLRSNINGKSIQLTKVYFPNSNKIKNELFDKIEEIDPAYQDGRFKKEVFISRITGEYIKLSSSIAEYENDLLDDLESIDNGTFEEREKEMEKEMTFFKALNNIFE